MFFGFPSLQLVFLLLIVIAVVGAMVAVTLPLAGSSGADTRVKALVAERKSAGLKKQAPVGRLIEGQSDSRRRRIQETLKQIEERAAPGKRGVSLRTQIGRAGLSLSARNFWLLSGATGLMMALLTLLFGFPLFIGALNGIVGFLGIPRWLLSYLARRRQKLFLEDFADAVDVMVRGLKAGLPLSDAMRVIATESGPPIGSEFMEVVEGQRVGISIDQGLERMFERMPLPEVSFLGIVINIQSKAGGNLSEALSNLSKVLRDRKKMKAKIRSMSQEAKSSASIIGALPFLIVGALFLIAPTYLQPLIATSSGHMILISCGVWMFIGIMFMRKMTNFDI